jgi:hypothetical protein
MAVKFKRGDQVKVVAVVPQGPVVDVMLDADGDIQYLVKYQDASGEQFRWFKESELAGV